MDLRQIASEAASRYGIPEELFFSLIQQESSWKPDVVSSAGAIGPAQLMPGTAKQLGVDPYDPKQNIFGGARYLRQQYDTFGQWPLALAAYNAGPGAVQKYGGIPPYKETQAYVPKVLGRTSMGTGGMPAPSQPRISTQGAAPMDAQQAPQQPRGLLGLFGPREDDPRSPAERRRDILSNLAIGLSGLSMFPNTAMINALQGGIQERRETRKELLAAEKALQSKSRTVEWLRSPGVNRPDLAAAVEAGALDGQSAASLAFEKREPGYTTMTGKQLNEQFGVQLPEAELYNVSGKGQITKVGGAGTTITMPGAEKAWDKGIGEYGVKLYERIQDEARAAGDMLNSAAQLEALMADPNFRSGALSEPMIAGKKIIEALGGDPANVSSMEAFKSVTGRLILDSMGGSLGAGFSEGDRKFVEGMQPSLDASMAGNRLILSMQRAIAARRQQIAEFADNYVAENGMLDARFNAALRKWAEANPLFTQGASAGSYFGGNP